MDSNVLLVSPKVSEDATKGSLAVEGDRPTANLGVARRHTGTLEHLNHLIAVAKDSELGYRTAAEHVDDSHLATVFADYAKQRAGFVEALALEVRPRTKR